MSGRADVLIVDYGVGNLFNIQRAFDRIGVQAAISTDYRAIADAPRLLLPGVGAFETGMKYLAMNNLAQAVKDFAKTGRPLLGICLGMQLLMDESEEHGIWPGLALVPGRVTALTKWDGTGDRFKIPHIGWSGLTPPSGAREQWRGTVLENADLDCAAYFVHSFRVAPRDQNDSVAVATYGRDTFCAVLRRGNLHGCQFHPERSGEVGLAMLRTFASLEA